MKYTVNSSLIILEVREREPHGGNKKGSEDLEPMTNEQAKMLERLVRENEKQKRKIKKLKKKLKKLTK